ncbi:hypothetical protein [Sneathiella sp. HT1-7]|uniref:hypothetical protein n=1 Tax=Sneathiella sp. HT1-7 TaxID=2887192 RepID=UPI001D14FC31|nr:hypothetical protein [Sneathiella sp. HT1-7]MCC3305848.1 hypothetical protein [Sneathiella sp. HT1-7]
MSFKLLIVAGLVGLLVACNGANTDTAVKDESPMKATLSNYFYHQLMAAAGVGKVSDKSYNAEIKIGDTNPYNNGSLIHQYKAMAMCVSWDVNTSSDKKTTENAETIVETKTTNFQIFARPKAVEISNSDDWNVAGFNSLRNCEQKKLQKELNCNCQLVDRDDTNVLEIPDDILQFVQPNNISQ